MKWMIVSLMFFLLSSCGQNGSRNFAKKEASAATNQTDSPEIDTVIKNFNSKYKVLEKSLYDSVSKYKTDDIDFSCITGGIEKKYNECGNEVEKVLIGYKLAGNYLIHYDSSKKVKFKQKAEPLFYSFISYQDGVVASMYMKLDLPKVQYMRNEWNNFSDKDKETLLFYGLLRGFNNGIPEFLKKVEVHQ